MNTDATLLCDMLKLATRDDVNAPDENGNSPLHVAVSCSNPVAIQYLIQSGARRSAKDLKGHTPMTKLLKQRENKSSTFSTPRTSPTDVESFLDSAYHLMSKVQSRQLVDGWLSPRMLRMLEMTAAMIWDSINGPFTDSRLKNYAPTSLPICFDMCDGIEYIQYIPFVEISKKNPDGLYKSFEDGWGIVWEAIASLLHTQRAPTLTRVEQEIYNIGADLRKWSHFAEKGGKIEYALDALLDVARNLHLDGWFENDSDDDALPDSPLDGAFDVARVKCLESNNHNWLTQPAGPYRHTFNHDYGRKS